MENFYAESRQRLIFQRAPQNVSDARPIWRFLFILVEISLVAARLPIRSLRIGKVLPIKERLPNVRMVLHENDPK